MVCECVAHGAETRQPQDVDLPCKNYARKRVAANWRGSVCLFTGKAFPTVAIHHLKRTQRLVGAPDAGYSKFYNPCVTLAPSYGASRFGGAPRHQHFTGRCRGGLVGCAMGRRSGRGAPAAISRHAQRSAWPPGRARSHHTACTPHRAGCTPRAQPPMINRPHRRLRRAWLMCGVCVQVATSARRCLPPLGGVEELCEPKIHGSSRCAASAPPCATHPSRPADGATRKPSRALWRVALPPAVHSPPADCLSCAVRRSPSARRAARANPRAGPPRRHLPSVPAGAGRGRQVPPKWSRTLVGARGPASDAHRRRRARADRPAARAARAADGARPAACQLRARSGRVYKHCLLYLVLFAMCRVY